jgi:hypothetical protein
MSPSAFPDQKVPAWEAWLSQQGIAIEIRKTWKYGGEALYLVTLTAICWSGYTRVCGAFSKVLARIIGEYRHITH